MPLALEKPKFFRPTSRQRSKKSSEATNAKPSDSKKAADGLLITNQATQSLAGSSNTETPSSRSTHQLTIKPRSKGALGFAQYLPPETQVFSKLEMLDRVTMALAGRAAEVLFLESASTGAADDFRKAHDIVLDLVTTYGMSDSLKYVRFSYDEMGRRVFSDATQKLIDDEVAQILKEQMDRATELLKQKKEVIEKMVEVLLDKESLTFLEVRQILGERPFPPHPAFKRFLDEIKQNEEQARLDQLKQAEQEKLKQEAESQNKSSEDQNSNQQSPNQDTQDQPQTPLPNSA